MRPSGRAISILGVTALAGATLLVAIVPSDRTIARMFEADGQLDPATAYLVRWNERHPQDYASRRHAADLLLQTARPARALAVLDEMAVDWPRDVDVLARAIEVEDSLLHVEATVPRLEALAAATPDDPAILGKLVDLYRWFGDVEKTNDVLVRLVPLGDFPEEREELIEILLANRRYDELIDIFSKEVVRRPDQVDAHLALYQAYVRTRRPDDAIKQLAAVLALDPERIEVLRDLGELLIEQDRWDEVLALYAGRHAADPTSPLRGDLLELYGSMAESELEKGDRARAIELFRRRLELDPTNLQLRLDLAEAYGASANQVAIKLLRELTVLAPSNVEAWRALAEHLTWQNDLTAAIATYREALKLAPGELELRRGLAQSLVWADQLPAAIAEYRALVAKGQRAIDHAALIEVLLDADLNAEAFTEAKALIARNGPSLRHRRLLALAAEDAATCGEVMDTLRTLTPSGSKDRQAWHNRALCATRLGLADEARMVLERVERLDGRRSRRAPEQ